MNGIIIKIAIKKYLLIFLLLGSFFGSPSFASEKVKVLKIVKNKARLLFPNYFILDRGEVFTINNKNKIKILYVKGRRATVKIYNKHKLKAGKSFTITAGYKEKRSYSRVEKKAFLWEVF